ncbi:hypothetical protein V6Z11_A10G147800 [Gossypium hirsutum]
MFVVGSFFHWRTLALLATIPALLQLVLLFFIPESPQWLNISMRAKFGCEKELEAALLCLRGDKADISHEATEIKVTFVFFLGKNLSFYRIMSEGILDIFQKKYVRPLLIVAGVLVLMNLGGINALTRVLVLMNLGGINALTYYSGAIFVSAGVSSMVGLITLAATQILKVRQRIQSLQAGKAKA